MMNALLVTGIHREELEFGDRVAAILGQGSIPVMRIPEGISHASIGTDDLFYYNARHQEIYRQLAQQVKGSYRLLIDLHSGLNDSGRCADIYCQDEQMLRCISVHSEQADIDEIPRLVKIVADSEKSYLNEEGSNAYVKTLTSIPQEVWNNRGFLYVGMEIYLAQEGGGSTEEWHFARHLIGIVQECIETY